MPGLIQGLRFDLTQLRIYNYFFFFLTESSLKQQNIEYFYYSTWIAIETRRFL